MTVGRESKQIPRNAPIRGTDTSLPESKLSDLYSPDMTNYWTKDGALEKRTGYSQFLTGFPSAFAVMEGIEYGDVAGVTHGLIFTRQKMIEYLPGSPATWVDRTPSGSPMTGTIDDHVFASSSGEIGAENLYFTNGKDVLKSWDGADNFYTSITVSGGAAFTTLISKSLIGYKGHLIHGNVKEDATWFPYRIRWSRPGLPENYDTTTGTAGFVNLIEDKYNGPIHCPLPLRDYLIVYKDYAVYNLSYYGAAPSYFVSYLVIPNKGTISPKGVDYVLGGEAHLVVSHDNIYLYDAYEFQKPFFGNAVKKKFFADLTWANRNRVFVRSFNHLNECWILYPGGGSATPSKLMIWNWKEDSITFHSLAAGGHSLFEWVRLLSAPAALYGINSDVMILDGSLTDNGTTITATCRTALNDLGAKNIRKSVDRVDLEITESPSVRVGYADNPFESIDWGTSQTIQTDENGVKFHNPAPRKAGRYVSIEVADASPNTRSKWADYTIYTKPGGIR